jgi:hypothetical protein
MKCFIRSLLFTGSLALVAVSAQANDAGVNTSHDEDAITSQYIAQPGLIARSHHKFRFHHPLSYKTLGEKVKVHFPDKYILNTNNGIKFFNCVKDKYCFNFIVPEVANPPYDVNGIFDFYISMLNSDRLMIEKVKYLKFQGYPAIKVKAFHITQDKHVHALIVVTKKSFYYLNVYVPHHEKDVSEDFFDKFEIED